MHDVIETLLNAHGDLLAAGDREAAADVPMRLFREDVVALLGIARLAKDALPSVRPTAAFRARLGRDLRNAADSWPPPQRAHHRTRLPALRGARALDSAARLVATAAGPSAAWIRRHAAAAAVSGSAAVAVMGAAALLWRHRTTRRPRQSGALVTRSESHLALETP